MYGLQYICLVLRPDPSGQLTELIVYIKSTREDLYGHCILLRLNKRLSKQSWGLWFETTSRPLWYHRKVIRPGRITAHAHVISCI